MSNLGGVGPDTDAEPWLYYEGIGTLYGGQVLLVYLLLPTLLYTYHIGPDRPGGRG